MTEKHSSSSTLPPGWRPGRPGSPGSTRRAGTQKGFLEEMVPPYITYSSQVHCYIFPKKNKGNSGLIHVSTNYSTYVKLYQHSNKPVTWLEIHFQTTTTKSSPFQNDGRLYSLKVFAHIKQLLASFNLELKYIPFLLTVRTVFIQWNDLGK